jgi:pimeloyl-ACP methyl ester carboxylesterase
MPLIHIGNSASLQRRSPHSRFQCLFVHGAAARSRGFRLLIHHLIIHSPWPLTFYELDLPGHGYASHNPAPQNLEEHSQEVIAALERIADAVCPTVLIGHSMGGAIAQIAARERPDLLTALIIMASADHLPIPTSFLDMLQKNYQTMLQQSHRFLFAQSTPLSWRHAFLQDFFPTPPLKVAYHDFIACSKFDQRSLTEQIKVPTLVIAGREDKLIAEKFSREMAAKLPQSCYKVVNEAGHLVFLERAGQVSISCIHFLSQFDPQK